MATLIDSSLWVDYFRPKTPASIRHQVIEVIDSVDAALCEPVRFEILRAARRHERKFIEEAFATMPFVSASRGLWDHAAGLGQKCTDTGFNPPAMDLLIASIAIAHDATLATFDLHFQEIAKVSPLKLLMISRQ